MGDRNPPGPTRGAATDVRAGVGPRSAAVDAALRAADASGRAAWPGIALDPQVFQAHVLDHVRSARDVAAAIASLHVSDLFLACACAEGLPAAIAELERVHLSRVATIARRFDPSPAFADDVAQTMREAFLVPPRGSRPRIAEYSGRGALASWVRVVAVRTALRLRSDARRGGGATDEEGEGALRGLVDPELDHLKLRYRSVYEDALRAALADLPDRDALLLQLNYVDGLNIDRIGAVFGVHRSTVARWRAEVRAALLARVRDHVRRNAALTASQFESLLALVRSQLAVSIRALARPSGAAHPGVASAPPASSSAARSIAASRSTSTGWL